MAALAQRPLPGACPVRVGGAAVVAGAEQQVVLADLLRVDPVAQHRDELLGDRDGSLAGLGLAGLVEGDVGLADLDAPHPSPGRWSASVAA